jgi:Uma2 family endonuclease
MSTVETATKLMTADEFYDFVHRPENADRFLELVRGEVIELASPTKPHGFLCANVARIVGNYTFQRKKGYVTSNDTGVIVERDPDTVRGPDVAMYEDAVVIEEIHPKYGEVPPLLAVEVLSPEDRASQILRKIAEYIKSGVKLVWVVDLESRSVTVYRPDKPQEVLTGDQELTGDGILPGFRCKISEVFRLPGDERPEGPAA